MEMINGRAERDGRAVRIVHVIRNSVLSERAALHYHLTRVAERKLHFYKSLLVRKPMILNFLIFYRIEIC